MKYITFQELINIFGHHTDRYNNVIDKDKEYTLSEIYNKHYDDISSKFNVKDSDRLKLTCLISAMMEFYSKYGSSIFSNNYNWLDKIFYKFIYCEGNPTFRVPNIRYIIDLIAHINGIGGHQITQKINFEQYLNNNEVLFIKYTIIKKMNINELVKSTNKSLVSVKNRVSYDTYLNSKSYFEHRHSIPDVIFNWGIPDEMLQLGEKIVLKILIDSISKTLLRT